MYWILSARIISEVYVALTDVFIQVFEQERTDVRSGGRVDGYDISGDIVSGVTKLEMQISYTVGRGNISLAGNRR